LAASWVPKTETILGGQSGTTEQLVPRAVESRSGVRFGRRWLAYWFTKEDIEPWRSLARVNDTAEIRCRDECGHHQVGSHYLPDRRGQTRGVTAFAGFQRHHLRTATRC